MKLRHITNEKRGTRMWRVEQRREVEGALEIECDSSHSYQSRIQAAHFFCHHCFWLLVVVIVLKSSYETTAFLNFTSPQPHHWIKERTRRFLGSGLAQIFLPVQTSVERLQTPA